MKPTGRAFLLSLIALTLTHCGGGGGGDDDNILVGGNWSGAVTKASDTCPQSAAPATVNFQHVVAQNEEAITLVDNNGAQYLGNIVGGEGFSADAATTGAIIGTTCPTSNRVEYHDIHDDDDTTANIEIRVTQSCPGQAACEILYTGTASKAVTASPSPSPAATNSPTAVSGGCLDINAATASGSFSGDGGCGISAVRYSTSGSTVFLEPFGANGSTSFALDPANSSSGTSTRSDLTINGESGYQCGLVCSAPSTFTVTCRKEGADSCDEKF